MPSSSQPFLRLHEGEEIVEILTPHPMAFVDFYGLFLYMVLVGTIFSVYQDRVAELVGGIPIVGLKPEISLLVIWAALLILPFLVVAVLKISWRWLLLSIGVTGLGLVLRFWLGWPEGYMQLPAIAVGVIGLLLTDVYRRSHDFYLTTDRIVTELGFVSHKRREISYSKISDLVVTRGILGRLFNYGSILPVSPSGFGLGGDISLVTAGTSGGLPRGLRTGVAISGGKTVSVPRGRSSYVLFGVSRPGEIYDIISQLMHEQEQAPYLKRIASDVAKLVKERGETSR